MLVCTHAAKHGGLGSVSKDQRQKRSEKILERSCSGQEKWAPHASCSAPSPCHSFPAPESAARLHNSTAQPHSTQLSTALHCN